MRKRSIALIIVIIVSLSAVGLVYFYFLKESSPDLSGSIPSAQATGNPQQYNGKSICIHGRHVSHFETSVMNDTIWVRVPVDRKMLKCRNTDYVGEGCSGQVKLCGVFHWKSDFGSDTIPLLGNTNKTFEMPNGFGHLGQYRFELAEQ